MAEQRPRTAPATDRALVLQTITAAFGHTLGTLEAAAVAVQQGMAVLGAHAGAVILRTDESEYQLLARAGYDLRWGTQAHVLPSAPWPIVDAAENGTPVWIPSRDVYARRYPHLTTAFNAQTQAVAALPLLFDGRSIGALGLSFACAQRFSAGQRAMLETLAQLCAQALQRATLAEAVERQRREVEEAVRIRDDYVVGSTRVQNAAHIAVRLCPTAAQWRRAKQYIQLTRPARDRGDRRPGRALQSACRYAA